MWLPVLGLLIGILIGVGWQISLPIAYSSYMAVGILAAIDSVFGGVRAALDNNYDNVVFLSGFFTNILLAIGLTYLGVKLGVDLVLGATVAFSIRIFNNLGMIRRHMILGIARRWGEKKARQKKEIIN
ncbi:MAG: small basic family protein [Firmicutes bacterium]|jgi:small basic protein|nr:small basic family protein [Bacillota bacterium]HOB21763.1 small basic family protein [Bacillota bacterium]HQD39049.1 small basic family protein [Bacillota bacterium]